MWGHRSSTIWRLRSTGAGASPRSAAGNPSRSGSQKKAAAHGGGLQFGFIGIPASNQRKMLRFIALRRLGSVEEGGRLGEKLVVAAAACVVGEGRETKVASQGDEGWGSLPFAAPMDWVAVRRASMAVSKLVTA